jgi:hypothetical protein
MRSHCIGDYRACLCFRSGRPSAAVDQSAKAGLQLLMAATPMGVWAGIREAIERAGQQRKFASSDTRVSDGAEVERS